MWECYRILILKDCDYLEINHGWSKDNMYFLESYLSFIVYIGLSINDQPMHSQDIFIYLLCSSTVFRQIDPIWFICIHVFFLLLNVLCGVLDGLYTFQKFSLIFNLFLQALCDAQMLRSGWDSGTVHVASSRRLGKGRAPKDKCVNAATATRIDSRPMLRQHAPRGAGLSGLPNGWSWSHAFSSIQLCSWWFWHCPRKASQHILKQFETYWIHGNPL